MKTFATSIFIACVYSTIGFMVGTVAVHRTPPPTVEQAYKLGYADGMTHAADMATGKLRTENDSRKRLEDDLNRFNK